MSALVPGVIHVDVTDLLTGPNPDPYAAVVRIEHAVRTGYHLDTGTPLPVPASWAHKVPTPHEEPPAPAVVPRRSWWRFA